MYIPLLNVILDASFQVSLVFLHLFSLHVSREPRALGGFPPLPSQLVPHFVFNSRGFFSNFQIHC